MTPDFPFEPSPAYDEMLSSIKALAANLQGLQALGVAQYAPVVEHIVATRCRDAQHIERTLDHILDFACHPDGLVLFKSLCRYYFPIDPEAAASYVHAYREMWDSDETEDRSV
jgi:hypothetical protein